MVGRAGEVQRASDYAEVWFAFWVPVERGREEEAAAAARPHGQLLRCSGIHLEDWPLMMEMGLT